MSIDIGTYKESGQLVKVSVDVELRRTPAESETIYHEAAPPTHTLSISGGSWRRPVRGGRWSEYAFGQIDETVAEVTDFAEGWDVIKRDELLRIWDRWHLNTMRAACAHMVPAPVGTVCEWGGFTIGRIDNPVPRPLTIESSDGVGLVTGGQEVTLSHYTVNRALECPLTGYRYGAAWLVEPLPEKVIRWAEKLGARR